MPIKIKRDKNKSESIYYILNSNQRGHPQTREDLVYSMQQEKSNRYLLKLLTIIAAKLEEKFTTLSKAFLFFDTDQDQEVNRAEFHIGMERMRIKLSKEDVDVVFDYLDKDKDENISYNEFTEFSEEKRRKIDPF